MGTVERRLHLMKILCQRRCETMSNLAIELGVSKRTIQRDMDEISPILPIYIKCGRYEGGVYVMDGYCIDRMYMSEKELALLNKIKDHSLTDQNNSLENEEIKMLKQLIRHYTKPAKKYVKEES